MYGLCMHVWLAAGVMDEELRQAEDKFQESKQLAEIAMQNLLDNDVSHALFNFDWRLHFCCTLNAWCAV